MSDYSKNFETLMTGHTGGASPEGSFPKRTSLDDTLDVRDLVSAIVGAGKGGLHPTDQQAVYSRLGVILGKPTAQKLINQALVFNERTDVLNKNAEQRINQFYESGSSDPEVNQIIQKAKNIEHGPISGARDTPNDLTNKVIAGASTSPVIAKNNNVADLQKSSGL